MFASQVDFAQTLSDLRTNKVSLKSYIKEVCERIEAVDTSLHSLLPEPDRYTRLIKEAEQLEKLYPEIADRPPLYGVLLGVKDIFRVKGFATMAGSLLPANLFAGPEAEVVTRLRKAGVLILGKTVTTEFAYYEPGPTANPHNIGHTPGGSSSGSAAAVSAGLSTLALGTQTMGSISRPGAFCGVVGFKPSLGRISTSGLIHFSKTMDQIGIFTQSMEGVEITASILCDGWTQEKVISSPPVLGVPEGPYMSQVPSESLVEFESQLNKLSDAGYLIKRIPVLKDIDRINQLHSDLVISELAAEHRERFERFGALYRNVTKDGIQRGFKVSNETIKEAGRISVILREELHAAMDKNEVDLWICPSTLGPAPKGIQSTGDPIMNVPWTSSGMPTITIPAGRAPNNLPIGLQVIGRYMKDEQLVNWVRGLEKVFNFTSVT